MVNGRLWTKMTVMKNTRWSVCPVAGWLAWYHWFDPIPGELVSEWISSPTWEVTTACLAVANVCRVRGWVTAVGESWTWSKCESWVPLRDGAGVRVWRGKWTGSSFQWTTKERKEKKKGETKYVFPVARMIPNYCSAPMKKSLLVSTWPLVHHSLFGRCFIGLFSYLYLYTKSSWFSFLFIIHISFIFFNSSCLI